jgi:hypothetical protein
MFATTFGTRKLQGVRNSWHSGCWVLKFIVYAVSIVTPFVIPSIFIQLYGKFFVDYLRIQFVIHNILGTLSGLTQCTAAENSRYDALVLLI